MFLDPLVHYYKNRAGDKVGPVYYRSHLGYYQRGNDPFYWFPDGRRTSAQEVPDDLVSIWIEGVDDNIKQTLYNEPFGEKMTNKKLTYKKVVEADQYGIVAISLEDDEYGVLIDETVVSSDDLFDAIEVLKELAEFLKENGE